MEGRKEGGSVRLTLDTREPEPWPWAAHLSADVVLERGTLEHGDVAVARLHDGAVVERKTVDDLLACIGRERERFELALRRGRYAGRFAVAVEGSLHDLLRAGAQRLGTGRGGIAPAAILGSIANWGRRYCPFLFCGDVATAARLAESFLRGQVREVERAAKALATARVEGAPAGRKQPSNRLDP